MGEPAMSQGLPVNSTHNRKSEARKTWQEDPTFANTNWRQWPLVKLRVEGLPPSTSTLQIYNNLSRYGEITRITLSEEKAGQRTITSEVTFEPPPQDCFWDGRALEFVIDHQRANPRARLDRYQPASKSIKSPLRHDVEYNEKNELHGISLSFGVLSDPATMLTMASCGDVERQVRLVLNLRKKEIEVYFPFLYTSEKASAWRVFRFIIALDDQLAIWRLPTENYVLHLSKPPWYSKKLVEAIAQTHASGGRRWAEEDTWARQTDIFAYKSTLTEIRSSPVTLHKELNEINLFRWTTFHFRTLPKARTDGSAKTFFDALHDWNIKVLNGESFKIRGLAQSKAQIEHTVWTLINGTHDDKKVYTLSQELTRISLPFSVRYQLEVCLSHGWLSEYSIRPEFLRRLSQWGESKAKQALVYIDTNQERLYDPMVLFTDLQYSKPVRPKLIPDSCVEIHSATVTATGILFHTPTVEITNRIIRNHKTQSHRFLRVRFEDDEYRGQSRLYPTTNNKMIMIFERVKRALSRGIKLGNIHYDFLAWGNSQLREHGVYFFAATDNINVDRIRAEMGNFEENVVAKKCARMGQCFSSTKAVHLQLPQITMSNVIPDIIRGSYNFTDGVGKISPLAASIVSDQLGMKIVPSLFQFRLGGCKGVLAVSKDVHGMGVLIRKSQFKFSSLSGELEIIRCAEFWQAFLNRQIIICLNNLGVRTEIFLNKQNDAIKALERALQEDGAAIKALRTNVDPNRMTLSLAELVEAGFRTSKDPFVIGLLHLWRAWSLKYLKEKAKIPVTDGAFVLGSVDETGTLRGHTKACPSGKRETIEQNSSYMKDLPQIFLQITDPQTGQRRIIEGLCILARNPSLHAGDIRVVRAVNVSCLNHMCDVVIMPQTGDRDLPSMCSGGDLDGDDYIVIWDKELIPALWNVEPFHYDPPEPKIAQGEITTSDMITFFYDYLQNDSLGRIATAHLAAADEMPDSLWDQSCLELAALHSKAVDYPKTGVPARMERRHERNQWPHFMEKKNSKEYHSRRVLGQLYDAVQKINFAPNWTLPFDSRILHAFKPPRTLYESVQHVKKDYDSSLRRILNQHEIGTEFELWSTFVLHHSKAFKDFKFHEEVGMLSRTLKEQFYDVLVEIAKGKDYEHLAPLAVAAYRCTYDELQMALNEVELGNRKCEPNSMPFISFPWILQDTLIKIVVRAGDVSSNEIITGIKAGDIVGLQASEDSLKTDLAYHPILTQQHEKEEKVENHYFSEHLDDPYQPFETRFESPIAVGNASEGNETTAVGLDSSTLKNHPAERLEKSLEKANPSITISGPTKNVDIESAAESPESVERYSVEETINLPKTVNGLESKSEQPRIETEDINVLEELTGEMSIAKASPLKHDAYISMSSKAPAHVQNAASELSHPQSNIWTGKGLVGPPEVDKFFPRSEKETTCHFWKTKNNCMYTADECQRAHWDTGHYGIIPRETCWFWKRNGHCANTAEQCLFAHYDTGFVAPRPWRSIVTNSSVNTGAAASPTKRMVQHDSDSDEEEEEHVNRKFAWPSMNSHRNSPLAHITAAKSTKVLRYPASRAIYPYHNPHLSYNINASKTVGFQDSNHELDLRDIDYGRSPLRNSTLSDSEGQVHANKLDPVIINDNQGPKLSKHISENTSMGAPRHSSVNAQIQPSLVVADPPHTVKVSISRQKPVETDDTSTLSGIDSSSRPLSDPFETASGINDFGSDVVFG